MARIFITGSSDGLGLLAGKQLAAEGHRIVLHARNEARAAAARAALPDCETVVIGDVATLAAMDAVADQANASGRFDAVIHNVAIGYGDSGRQQTEDGLARIFAINVVAPYVLTAKIARPDRLIYLSSGMHRDGKPDLEDAQWKSRRWNGTQAYSDSKLNDTILAMAIARRWPNVLVNAVDPGWVATKMGGPNAPDDPALGADTQAWLAVSNDAAAKLTGQYFHHRKPGKMAQAARDPAVQDRLLAYLAQTSGVALS